MGRKWNNIKEKKASKDANTSRIYAKFGREIYVVAKQGEPDPELNQALKLFLNGLKHIMYQGISLIVPLKKQRADRTKTMTSFVMKVLDQAVRW